MVDLEKLQAQIDYLNECGLTGMADIISDAKKEILQRRNTRNLICQVGDKVYAITRDFVSTFIVTRIVLTRTGEYYEWELQDGIYLNLRGFKPEDIGKSVFLSRETARLQLRKIKELEKTESKNL